MGNCWSRCRSCCCCCWEPKSDYQQMPEGTPQPQRQHVCQHCPAKHRVIAEYEDRQTAHEKEIERLTSQLSKYMHRKLNEDESGLENINSKNRPSKIVEDFNDLVNNEWLGAKDDLDSAHPADDLEQAKLVYLCDIIMEAHSLAGAHLGMLRARIQGVLLDPFPVPTTPCHVTSDGAPCDPSQLHQFDEDALDADLRSALVSHMKEGSHSVNIDQLVHELQQRIQTPPTLPNVTATEGLVAYMESACRLAWRMLVQNPPLQLITPGIGLPVSKDQHEVYLECPPHPENIISAYVYPIIAQKSARLNKGKVFVVPRSEAREGDTSQGASGQEDYGAVLPEVDRTVGPEASTVVPSDVTRTATVQVKCLDKKPDVSNTETPQAGCILLPEVENALPSADGSVVESHMGNVAAAEVEGVVAPEVESLGTS